MPSLLVGSIFSNTGTFSAGVSGAATSQSGIGVTGTNPNNVGVYGSGGGGVLGIGTFSYGVYGNSATNYGVYGFSGNSAGINGTTGSPTAAAAVFNNAAAGNILLGQSNGVTKFSVDGKGDVAASGSLTIGSGSGGTPIIEHLSLPFSVAFGPLKTGPYCAMPPPFSFPGASEGDTIALGVPNAMMTVSSIMEYSAWVSAPNTITIRACNLDPSTNLKTGPSGTIRVDVWKH